jgi:hypothetical protein
VLNGALRSIKIILNPRPASSQPSPLGPRWAIVPHAYSSNGHRRLNGILGRSLESAHLRPLCVSTSQTHSHTLRPSGSRGKFFPREFPHLYLGSNLYSSVVWSHQKLTLRGCCWPRLGGGARGGLRNFSHEALLLHCPAEGTSLPARACRACPPHNPRAPSCIRGQGHFGARDGRGACRIHWQCMQDSLAAESSERSLAVYRPASQPVKTVWMAAPPGIAACAGAP